MLLRLLFRLGAFLREARPWPSCTHVGRSLTLIEFFLLVIIYACKKINVHGSLEGSAFHHRYGKVDSASTRAHTHSVSRSLALDFFLLVIIYAIYASRMNIVNEYFAMKMKINVHGSLEGSAFHHRYGQVDSASTRAHTHSVSRSLALIFFLLFIIYACRMNIYSEDEN